MPIKSFLPAGGIEQEAVTDKFTLKIKIREKNELELKASSSPYKLIATLIPNKGLYDKSYSMAQANNADSYKQPLTVTGSAQANPTEPVNLKFKQLENGSLVATQNLNFVGAKMTINGLEVKGHLVTDTHENGINFQANLKPMLFEKSKPGKVENLESVKSVAAKGIQKS